MAGKYAPLKEKPWPQPPFRQCDTEQENTVKAGPLMASIRFNPR
jgi:hypothetical protein